MRTVTLIFSILAITTLSSCFEKPDTDTLLQNPVTRGHIFQSITSNHELMTEFRDYMQDNDHAMQMMQGNPKMAGNMMKDSMMMKNMMQSMMQDGKMMGNMMQMMHEKGMMSEDCMESCKNMMNEQGLDSIE